MPSADMAAAVHIHDRIKYGELPIWLAASCFFAAAFMSLAMQSASVRICPSLRVCADCKRVTAFITGTLADQRHRSRWELELTEGTYGQGTRKGGGWRVKDGGEFEKMMTWWELWMQGSCKDSGYLPGKQ